jgi:hypothetical protein
MTQDSNYMFHIEWLIHHMSCVSTFRYNAIPLLIPYYTLETLAPCVIGGKEYVLCN